MGHVRMLGRLGCLLKTVLRGFEKSFFSFYKIPFNLKDVLKYFHINNYISLL